ncbi:hypothetical protein Sango_2096400 [Sesamum angolense]|uniref:Uncharacterized protein n=1 Tax=Sesamum angolense TaxID=2727404 RepID=A0AAE1WBW2_9LAMI|nr:hypothetical protein Sango_2096400 [Sesamum angolense]
MAERSSVHSHDIKMLSLVEKLEDLNVGLGNDIYIDVIMQSRHLSYNPFIINYNMNKLEKFINELINILVQYEATAHKSVPTVLVGETSTSKAKGKRVGCWKRKKEKRKAIATTASTVGVPAAIVGKGKGKGKEGDSQRSRTKDVLERSRKLSKDEMILRLGDGKSEYVTKAMSFKKMIHSLSKRDRGISYALGDKFMVYEAVTIVIN